MATYKVIQDIEAEDKLIGPFGIRQFIYLIIVAVSGFVGFRLAIVAWFLVIPLIPHTLFFALLALPFGGEQPTETWLLAKIRFALKPRIRVWNQDGMQELVTVTAPKKIEKILTKSMSQGEVESRLKALANTIDSRGWAIKNVGVDVFSQPALAGAGTVGSSERLLGVMQAPSNTASFGVTASDDILDEQNNPTAQNLDRMISASTKAHRDRAVENMKKQPDAPGTGLPRSTPTPNPVQPTTQPAPQVPAGNWFAGTSQAPSVTPTMVAGTNPSSVVTPDPAAFAAQQGLPLKPLAPSDAQLTEEQLLNKIHEKKQHTPKSYGHMRVIKTLEEQEADARAAAVEAARAAAAEAAKRAVTPTPDPDILKLANNDDLNVETIARQANKKAKDDTPGGEVVINLH